MENQLSVLGRCKVAAWMEAFGSVLEVRQRFEAEFGENAPSRPTVYAIHRRFLDNGSVHDCSRSGRPKSARCDENIEAVSNIMSTNPTTSIRKASQETGISRSSVHRIMRIDLKLKPYRLQTVQQLYPEDEDRREEMCSLLLRRIFEQDDGDQFLTSLSEHETDLQNIGLACL